MISLLTSALTFVLPLWVSECHHHEVRPTSVPADQPDRKTQWPGKGSHGAAALVGDSIALRVSSMIRPPFSLGCVAIQFLQGLETISGLRCVRMRSSRL